MKQYDIYKDSGIEWIGEIPEHWQVVKIKQLAVGDDSLFIDGDWIESKEIVFDEDNIRYITTGNIGEGKYKEQGSGFITEETFEQLNCTEVFPGDLVISRLNHPIGRACIIPDLGKRIVTSVDNVVLRPNKSFSKDFLVHFFSNPKYYEYTLLEGRGATMQRISRGILGNIKIVIPDNHEEQTAIAAYLDRKTAEIDELIADKKRLLALYEEEKTAIINQAVTKGIDPDAPMKDSGIEWLGEVPEEWYVTSLKRLVETKITDGPHETPTFLLEGVPFISAEAVKNGKIDFNFVRGFISEDDDEKYSKKCKPKRNDIFIVKSGSTTGKVALVDFDDNFNIWSPLALVRVNEKVGFMFMYYALQSTYFQDSIKLFWSYGTQPNIGMNVIENLKVAFAPEIKEQLEIVQHIESRTSQIDNQISQIHKLIELLTEYRTALISEVVTGKIKIT